MTRKFLFTTLLITLGLVILACVAFGGAWLWSRLRLQPLEKEDMIFQGIRYSRQVLQNPRPLVVHIVKIDLRTPGISFLVTPGDPQSELPLEARTTSQFLDEFGLQLAVNGDGFSPWASNGPLDYYPHAGDPVAPLGAAASKGIVYARDSHGHPSLYISPTNQARFNTSPGKIYNVISGGQMLVERGQSTLAGSKADDTGSEGADSASPQPRTAIGLDKRMRTLIIVVVDGRQPSYSEGVTLAELADLMITSGAHNAMNLDGGGSSTLVMEGSLGQARLLNSPIDQQIPGRQRYVGNHLGIFARP